MGDLNAWQTAALAALILGALVCICFIACWSLEDRAKRLRYDVDGVLGPRPAPGPAEPELRDTATADGVCDVDANLAGWRFYVAYPGQRYREVSAREYGDAVGASGWSAAYIPVAVGDDVIYSGRTRRGTYSAASAARSPWDARDRFTGGADDLSTRPDVQNFHGCGYRGYAVYAPLDIPAAPPTPDDSTYRMEASC